MADQRSIELLAFTFASRTFAYERLAQGLQSTALSTFLFHARLTRPRHRNRSSRVVRTRHWNSRQYGNTTDT